ncbi:glutathione S-transferase [Mycena olivaceomarginata]|nr:glutathione S-transferase [Mycena olivaceomarginata]
MVLKLFGMPMATCARRVATILVEKKVPFEFVLVDFSKAEHKSPAYLASQPFGQVPYIVCPPLLGAVGRMILAHDSDSLASLLDLSQDDEGFILYESRAICRYIEDKYPNQGTPLVPTDSRGKALFEQAASIEYSNFDPFCSKAVTEMVFKPMGGQASNKAVFDELIETLSAKLDAYETILGNQRYLAGNEVTLADLFHIPYGTMLAKAGSDLMTTKGPNVTRWFNELCARPSWNTVKDGIISISSY